MGFLDIFKIGEYKDEIKRLSDENARLDGKLREIGADDYDAVQALVRSLQSNVETLKKEQEEAVVAYEKSKERINALEDKESKLNKSITTQTNKLSRSKELVKAILYTIENFYESDPMGEHLRISSGDMEEIEELSPSVILKLHSMDMKDLRSAYRQNDRQITQVMTQYESRYTTKANKAIYKLMVIALRAELQNILVSLKYDKLDNAIEKVKAVTQKYLSIAASGNQSIAGTLTKFIGEIEYLFINAVKIEYNYYVKKEQARQEQLAIREQIRQEAEERRALEQERKKVAAEESKYTAEIEKLKGQLSSAHEEEEEVIKGRILQLQSQLSEVVLKKEEISKLANGKAGNVYIISNLGSFGEDVALKYGFYACQNNRYFRKAKFMAFAYDNHIKNLFEILQAPQNDVDIQKEPQIASTDYFTIKEPHYKPEQRELFWLRKVRDLNIVNDTYDKNGRRLAYVQRQTYTTYDKIISAKVTSDL